MKSNRDKLHNANRLESGHANLIPSRMKRGAARLTWPPFSKQVIAMPTPLTLFALAVSHFEGHQGDRNYRNNNPGNLKFEHQRQATGEDAEGFAIFPSWDAGFRALEAQIALDARRTPGMTIAGFVEKYAPAKDGNPNNAAYSASIAAALYAFPTDTLGTLRLV